MVLIADADGPTSIAGVMGGARSEVAGRHHPGADGGGQLGRRQHPPHVAEARPAQRGLGALREAAPARAGAWRRRRWRPQLMIELCGARLLPGHDRRRRPGPAAQDDPPARRARRRACSGSRSRASAAPRSSPRSSSRPRTPPTGLDVTVPAFRRTDVTREADLIEEVARLGALRVAAGHAALAPRRLRAADRRPAAAPPRRRRAHRPGPARDRRLELRGPRAGRAAAASPTGRWWSSRTRCRPSSRGCARRCWARCSTSASATARAGRARCACSRPAPCTCPSPGPSRPRCPPSPTTSPRCSSGPVRPATWREPEPRDADFFAAKGVLARHARHAARPLDRRGRPRAEPFLHPGRAAPDPRRRRAGGLDRARSTPRRGRLGLRRRRGRLRARPRRGRRACAGHRATTTSRASPRSARTWR